MDIRNESYINVVDIYTKDGTHLSSRATTQNGEIVWEEGRQPGKDVVMIDPGSFEYSWKYWHVRPEPEWTDCKIEGCQNKSCRRLNSEYCHPHTILRELKHCWDEESS
jgi:hypothetical protein